MKILFILSRIPYPLEKGDKLRAFEQIRHLSKDHRIILFCLSDKPIHPHASSILNKYCERIEVVRLWKISLLTSLFKGLFSNKPFQIHYFFRQKAQSRLDKLIRETSPKHIFCQLVRTTEYVKKYSIIPKTLDYMDALSSGMLRRFQKGNLITRPFFKLEYQRLKRYESEIFPFFDNHVIISLKDKEAITHELSNRIQIIPNGVDTQFFQAREDVKPIYDIVFTGNMGYPPNVDAALYLAEVILPRLLKYFPKIKILIAGATPSSKVKALGNNKNIDVSGWVSDIRVAYSSGKIFVAPMQIGSGLQNKLLEAMSMGVPCITTPLANAALGAEPDRQVLIANDEFTFVKNIKLLLESPEKHEEIKRNALEFVKENFNWATSASMLSKVFHHRF